MAERHCIVILARLARVTLLTGHKYLGLTKEILTTEKAINEMACYPLPSEFYASGGMQRLRRRFVHESLSPNDTDPKVHDYFNAGPPSPRFGPFMGEQITKKPFNSEAVKLKWQPQTPHQRTRRMSKDSTASSDATIELTESPTRQRKTSGASLKSRSANVREPSLPSATESRGFSFHEKDHFDLRATVMQCIAKSMGLAQPSSMPSGSPSPSAPGSPSLGAQDTRFYSSSFGSLSALAQNMDETASASTMSSSKMHPNPELENEVEILFFPQGSTLVKNGQSNHGVYYVIDGFLDVLLPPDNKTSKSTPLFAVKPGGIAGYLASLTSSHSYVVRQQTLTLFWLIVLCTGHCCENRCLRWLPFVSSLRKDDGPQTNRFVDAGQALDQPFVATQCVSMPASRHDR